MARRRYFWPLTLLVLLAWITFGLVVGEDCSNDFLCFSYGDVLFLTSPFALGIWVLGILVAELARRGAIRIERRKPASQLDKDESDIGKPE